MQNTITLNVLRGPIYFTFIRILEVSQKTGLVKFVEYFELL